VDDNATNRRILTELLWHWEMRPASAASALEALSMLRGAAEHGHPFPLVLTDVHMPDMDGFELAERIRNTPRLIETAIVILTSADLRTDPARCRELGISTYLTKPVRHAELHAAISAALIDQAKTGGGTGVRAEMPDDPSDEAARPRLRILLAEDNVVNQRVAIHILEKGGHTVALAGSGKEALNALAGSEFDVVLMDVQMPEMDGLEAAAAVRQQEQGGARHIPIIAMTAHAMTGDRDRCLAAGMDDYISKPIRARELLQVVAKYGSQNVAV
jgi:two-component system, sensor histidine kinase and response regulator